MAVMAHICVGITDSLVIATNKVLLV